jgi:hypothetical protein
MFLIEISGPEVCRALDSMVVVMKAYSRRALIWQ